MAAEERDPDILRQMGALALAEGDGIVTVRAATDKPSDPSGYNAFWGLVAVAEDEAHRLPDVASKGADSPLVKRGRPPRGTNRQLQHHHGLTPGTATNSCGGTAGPGRPKHRRAVRRGGVADRRT